MKITDKQIRDWTTDVIYNTGLEIYRMGFVEDLHVNTNKLFVDEILEVHIDALVDSEGNSNNFEVNIRIDNVTKRMRMSCQCHNFTEKRTNGKPCEHITAALLKYVHQYQGITLKGLETMEVDKLIDEIKENVSTINNYKRELTLEVKLYKDLNFNSNAYIELKVGFDKLYTVKNMNSFLQAAYDMEALEFGRSFTFKPSEQSFSSRDNKIFDLLLDIYEIEKGRSQYQFYGSSNTLINGKKIELPEKQFIKLLNLLKVSPINIVINNKEYEDVYIEEKEMPLKLALNAKDETMELTEIGELPKPLDKGFKIFWYNNTIYMPPEHQIKIFEPFYNILTHREKRKALFNKAEGEKLISYILPALKESQCEIQLDDQLKNKLFETPLSIKVFLDKIDSLVTANIIFNYSNIELNPLKKSPVQFDNGILVRDIQKEETCQFLLKSFGFVEEKDQFVLKDEKDIIHLIADGLSRLQELSDIYYSDSFKSIKVYNKASISAGIQLSEDNLLEFTFELEGVDKSELADIFNSIKEKKKYHKLKKGEFVSLEDKEFQDVGRMLEFLNISGSDLQQDKLVLSKFNALYIDQSIFDNHMNYINRNSRFDKLISDIKEIKTKSYSLPENLDKIMRNYQKIGFNWFKTLSAYGFGGILADEMGLGKTLQTIAFLHSERNSLPSLVITPTSLVFNWKSEIEKFSNDIKVLVISGAKEVRDELLSSVKDYDIVITSYPLLRRDIDNYKNITFNYCILDEAQQIKNPSTLSATSVKEIKAKGYFALTGTPIENSLGELWSIFDFIMPGYLMSYNKFTSMYENSIVRDKDVSMLNELNRKIKPFILRRMKRDVLTELPPKIEQKLVVEMTEDQKKLYAAYMESAKDEITSEIETNGFNKSRMKILSVLTRLRQICCDPSVFIENYTGDSGKLLALEELLEDCISEGHKVLIFSQFTTVLQNISKRLSIKKIGHFYLDGHTKSEERLRLVNEFNQDATPLFLISLKAGGMGLNLTGADIVIHFDPWWNPAVENQATDRVHRIGQTNTVEVIKLLAQGTIEEKIYALQEKKKEIINSVINNDMNENNILSQMTEDELKGLFS